MKHIAWDDDDNHSKGSKKNGKIRTLCSNYVDPDKIDDDNCDCERCIQLDNATKKHVINTRK